MMDILGIDNYYINPNSIMNAILNDRWLYTWLIIKSRNTEESREMVRR